MRHSRHFQHSHELHSKLRRRYHNNKKQFTEINITPLTDIALVLLVIFMIAAPVLVQSSIKINLPKVPTKKSQAINTKLIIRINQRGNIFIDDKRISWKNLKLKIKNLAKINPSQIISIEGDKNVKYNSVIEVLNLLKNHDFVNIGLAIEIK